MNSFRAAILSGKGQQPADLLKRSKDGRGSVEDDLSSVEVARSEHRTADHRGDDRHRLHTETARARFDGEEHEVELINLSGGGAMIRADFAPRLWERIDLIFAEGSEIECAVRWLRGDRVGLEFAHETQVNCDSGAHDQLLLDVINRSFPEVERLHAEDGEAALRSETADDVTNSRRNERRHPLIWSGTLIWNHNSERVRLRNISENGALIEAPGKLAQGDEVMLDLGQAGQHFATVGWSCGDKAGLAFVKPFDVRLLVSSTPEIAHGQWVRPGPAALTEREDNPWAEGWQRASIDELREDLEGFLKR